MSAEQFPSTIALDSVPCAILGTGTMGAQIALSLALGGLSVTIWGRRAAALPQALAACAEGFDLLAEQGLAEPQARAETLERIVPCTDMAEAVGGRGFVLEAITEDLTLKQTLLCQAETLAPKEAVLSSTTSALSAGALQEPLARPENFCVAHYAQPAHLMELVEVVAGEKTAKQVCAFTQELLRHTGKVPVLCPDITGFLWARLQHAVLRECATLVGRGLVSAQDCDRVLKQGYAVRLPAMGPFEHADLAGLDLMNGAAAKAVWADLSTLSDPSETPVGTLFAQGHCGMSTGQGFYDWHQRDAEAFRRARDQEIIRRLKINREAQ